MKQWRAAEVNKLPHGGGSRASTWMLCITDFFITSSTDHLGTGNMWASSPGKHKFRGRPSCRSCAVRASSPMCRTAFWPDGNWHKVSMSQHGTGHQQEPRHSTTCPEPWKKHNERECREHAECTLELAWLKNGTSAQACTTSKKTHLEGTRMSRKQAQIIPGSPATRQLERGKQRFTLWRGVF